MKEIYLSIYHLPTCLSVCLAVYYLSYLAIVYHSPNFSLASTPSLLTSSRFKWGKQGQVKQRKGFRCSQCHSGEIVGLLAGRMPPQTGRSLFPGTQRTPRPHWLSWTQGSPGKSCFLPWRWAEQVPRQCSLLPRLWG